MVVSITIASEVGTRKLGIAINLGIHFYHLFLDIGNYFSGRHRGASNLSILGCLFQFFHQSCFDLRGERYSMHWWSSEEWNWSHLELARKTILIDHSAISCPPLIQSSRGETIWHGSCTSGLATWSFPFSCRFKVTVLKKSEFHMKLPYLEHNTVKVHSPHQE